ncbi:NAD(P)/FAD-dependent oxidoreductase [Pedobacter sp. MC2016-14]|uniref:NAD(P)/FAD-dependent oxidoreductase n=1 Tax=Pedobacter sp. MC2016-14 TaxID=2897327 RepID=UPI001E5E2F20|nr:NAD(P)/FAD-dependent oxidoreductase [Pedobacter sp. MC2016-14]MCD0490631.1 NAD(P)/FAD-dependent oxidoreductase [Pedobacter sp. MC2016-14]
MRYETDILIVGGGLAGLTSSIHLSRAGFNVILVEKDAYPKHKVCGEYISNEVLPYLQQLGADPSFLNPIQITDLEFSTCAGENILTKLPLGGIGLSRYTLDHYLSLKAVEFGVKIIIDTITEIHFENYFFSVHSIEHEFKAKLVLGAYGKRAGLDQQLKRNFIKHQSPWLAVKAHYKGSYPKHVVGLHNFKGGYCGVSNVEEEKINICYLTDYANFKKHKNINEHRENVLYKNKNLKNVFESCTVDFDSPLSISQISFERKELVKDHVLMIGDTAGLIHPLCGNGMGMAIHSAKICAELIVQYYERGTTKNQGKELRAGLEDAYKTLWHKNFRKRMLMGRMLATILRKEYVADKLFWGFVKFPDLLPAVIRQTHGKPLI